MNAFLTTTPEHQDILHLSTGRVRTQLAQRQVCMCSHALLDPLITL